MGYTLWPMDALPDLAGLSDQELRDLIRELVDEEQEVSYRRRLLHGRIDILRAELVARLHQRVEGGESPLAEVDLERLTAILASRGQRPAEEEPAAVDERE